MGSFYDCFSRYGLPFGVEAPYGRAVDEALVGATVVHVDSALDYWYLETPEEERIEVADYPNLTPRFAVSLLERMCKDRYFDGQAPSHLPWEDPLWARGMWHTGLLFEAIDLAQDLRSGAEGYEDLREDLAEHIGDRAYEEGVRWCLNIYLMGENRMNGVPLGPLVNWLLPVRSDGSPEPHISGRPATLMTCPITPDTTEYWGKRAFGDAALTYLLPALFAFTALNSPDVRLVATGKGYKPRGRSYNLDLVRLKERLNAEGKAKEFALGRAMHVCRNRFFRPEHRRKGGER